jgi:hypothetical protein
MGRGCGVHRPLFSSHLFYMLSTLLVRQRDRLAKVLFGYRKYTITGVYIEDAV